MASAIEIDARPFHPCKVIGDFVFGGAFPDVVGRANANIQPLHAPSFSEEEGQHQPGKKSADMGHIGHPALRGFGILASGGD